MQSRRNTAFIYSVPKMKQGSREFLAIKSIYYSQNQSLMNIIIDLTTPFSALQCRVRNKKINILVYTSKENP